MPIFFCEFGRRRVVVEGGEGDAATQAVFMISENQALEDQGVVGVFWGSGGINPRLFARGAPGGDFFFYLPALVSQFEAEELVGLLEGEVGGVNAAEGGEMFAGELLAELVGGERQAEESFHGAEVSRDSFAQTRVSDGEGIVVVIPMFGEGFVVEPEERHFLSPQKTSFHHKERQGFARMAAGLPSRKAAA